MEQEIKTKIENMLKSKRIFLFMKGTPDQPQCGFSARATQILQELEADFGYFNIFDDMEFTNQVKQYANWPTTPMLFVDCKLIGGCDIMQQLYLSGELMKIINLT